MATKKAATVKKASSSRKTVSTKTSSNPRTTVTTVSASAATATAPSFSESIRQFSFWRALAAEFIGTFLLAAVFVVGQGQPLYLFFAFVGIVLLVGTVSGAYVNPATTVAAWVTRRISWLRALGYIVFQVLGALVAYVVLNAFIGGAAAADPTTGTSANLFAASPITSKKEWYVFFAELLGTGIFAFSFANALRSAQDRFTAAFTAGVGLFIALMIAFIAASYVQSTAILNPAVATTLKAVTWNVWPLAIYVLAPIVGAIVGFFLNDLVKGRASK